MSPSSPNAILKKIGLQPSLGPYGSTRMWLYPPEWFGHGLELSAARKPILPALIHHLEEAGWTYNGEHDALTAKGVGQLSILPHGLRFSPETAGRGGGRAPEGLGRDSMQPSSATRDQQTINDLYSRYKPWLAGVEVLPHTTQKVGYPVSPGMLVMFTTRAASVVAKDGQNFRADYMSGLVSDMDKLRAKFLFIRFVPKAKALALIFFIPKKQD